MSKNTGRFADYRPDTLTSPHQWEENKVKHRPSFTLGNVAILAFCIGISSVGSVQHLYPAQIPVRDNMKSLLALGSAATILMDSIVAVLLRNVHGCKAKQILSKWLSENVEKTAASYGRNAVVASISMSPALHGLEPYSTWKRLPDETLIEPFNNSQGIRIVVAGDRSQSTWFATDFRFGRGMRGDNRK